MTMTRRTNMQSAAETNVHQVDEFIFPNQLSILHFCQEDENPFAEESRSGCDIPSEKGDQIDFEIEKLSERLRTSIEVRCIGAPYAQAIEWEITCDSQPVLRTRMGIRQLIRALRISNLLLDHGRVHPLVCGGVQAC
jgi:hypothetical protein